MRRPAYCGKGCGARCCIFSKELHERGRPRSGWARPIHRTWQQILVIHVLMRRAAYWGKGYGGRCCMEEASQDLAGHDPLQGWQLSQMPEVKDLITSSGTCTPNSLEKPEGWWGGCNIYSEHMWVVLTPQSNERMYIYVCTYITYIYIYLYIGGMLTS